MRILSIGSDRALFTEGAPVRERLREQAALVDRMEVVVFAPRNEQYVAITLSPKLAVRPTRSVNKWAYLPDAYRIARAIIKEGGRHDWLISAQDPFEAGAVGYLLAKTLRLPLHLQLHTDPFSPEWRGEGILNRLRYPLALFLLKQADGIRVVSERLERGVRALGIPAARITRIPIFTDVEWFAGATPSFDLRRAYPEARQLILSLGRLTREKNYAHLVRAFAGVAREVPDTLLLIVGDGPERARLLPLARSLGIEKNLRILPWARDTASYYKGADLYVQPSRYEGWGLAVVEAMASGTAVVMTDTGCAGEVVRHEATGLVVPAGDVGALTRAMIRLLKDPTLRSRLASAAQAETKKFPSKMETLARYEESWQNARETYLRRAQRMS